MSEIVISKGKNIQEAINSGLDLMELTKSQVHVEIIQHEDKKYFGVFGAKPAVVRLIKKTSIKNIDSEKLSINQEETKLPEVLDSQNHSSNLDIENNENNETSVNHGMVWVKNGKIFCRETSTHFPTITPSDKVHIYKNGELIRKTTVLMEKDHLKVEFQNERKELSWSISLDSLKVVATLQVEPGYRKTYRLVDQEPSPHSQLEVHLHEETIIHIQLNQIIQRMKELGINTGIQNSEIQRALVATEPGKFTIAKGIDSLNGLDGRVEYLVDNEIKINEPKVVPENGEVDYLEIVTIPHVDKGHLLGIIHPPHPGKTGKTVTGEEIPTKPTQEIVVHAQRGVDLIDLGTKIVSVKSGRANVQNKDLIAKVSVIPKLIHSSDVDISSGNLQYLGDIEIQGNVNEGTTVGAMTDIYIHGTVNRSTLTSGNRMIICRNVENSRLSSGEFNKSYIELGIILGRLSTDLKNFTSAVEQVYKSPVFKTSDIAKMGLSSLIRILLEKKFKDLPSLIKEFSELVLKAGKQKILNGEFKEISTDLNNGFLKLIPTQFKDSESIISLVGKIDDVYELFMTSQDSGAHITVPFAQNCEISCSGDISILGKGCIDSNIHSKGYVKIQGVLYGGLVYAARGIEAEETGNAEGSISRITVPEGQSIKINNANRNTIIQIGNLSHKFVSLEQNIFARVKDGRLLLY